MAKVVYNLPDGSQVSRAEYARYLFKTENKSRDDIAKELKVPYSTIYSATANMENEFHKAGKPGGPSRRFVEMQDGTRMGRSEYVRMRIKEGATRGEIAKELDTSYSAVWAASKGMEELTSNGPGGKIMIMDPETGKQVPRVDFIRTRYAEGMTRREIADLLKCDYAIVWATTHVPKTETPQDEASTSELWDETDASPEPAEDSEELAEAADDNFPE